MIKRSLLLWAAFTLGFRMGGGASGESLSPEWGKVTIKICEWFNILCERKQYFWGLLFHIFLVLFWNFSYTLWQYGYNLHWFLFLFSPIHIVLDFFIYLVTNSVWWSTYLRFVFCIHLGFPLKIPVCLAFCINFSLLFWIQVSPFPHSVWQFPCLRIWCFGCMGRLSCQKGSTFLSSSSWFWSHSSSPIFT